MMILDGQCLADARRLGLQDGVPVLLKCVVCGRSERIVESAPVEVVEEMFSRL
jgi:hypothetical protein